MAALAHKEEPWDPFLLQERTSRRRTQNFIILARSGSLNHKSQVRKSNYPNKMVALVKFPHMHAEIPEDAACPRRLDAGTRSWYDFWTWEALYAAQFFSLEFFFRGFWLRAGKQGMGSHAIYAMVVPYCMIHFGKPFLETLAAILAGLFLGTLALRTRSIWSGFLIHVGVAISMDLAALAQTTGLPDRWWPDL